MFLVLNLATRHIIYEALKCSGVAIEHYYSAKKQNLNASLTESLLTDSNLLKTNIILIDGFI
jgi:hypothetical protein